MDTIKCKDALYNSACGKDICCVQCRESYDCRNICVSTPDVCSCAITEENKIIVLRKDYGDVIQAVADFETEKKKIEDREKEMRETLKDAMEKYGVISLDCGNVKFSYVPPSTRTSLDAAKLKNEMPEVAEKYSKTSPVSSSVRITVK